MDSTFDLQRALAVAVQAATTAGAGLVQARGAVERVTATSKSSARDLVTAADVASEQCIVGHLRSAFPEHAIEAEEQTHDALDDRPRWIVDPLDGTVNYVHGLPLYCVSIALWHAGAAQVAVVHAPSLGETWTAVRGAGAYRGTQRLQVSATRTLGEGVVATGFPYRRQELPNPNVGNFNRFVLDVRGIRRCGSAALDLAWTAAGRFDAYWELHLAPHDIAAGGLLVEEAGGLVTTALGAADWLRAGHIIAANPHLHPLVLERVRV
jgi:myo-inositol-1(or 4)-monophosphatase